MPFDDDSLTEMDFIQLSDIIMKDELQFNLVLTIGIEIKAISG